MTKPLQYLKTASGHSEPDWTAMDKSELLKFDNFVFDLYGTLIDLHTDEWATETWGKWIDYLDGKGRKHPPLADFRRDFFDLDREYREKPTPFDNPEIDVLDVYAELFERYGNTPVKPEELFEDSHMFRVFSTEYIRLFPKVKEFLVFLHEKGKKVFLLSNAQRSYTLPELEGFGLIPLFDDYLISSDYKCMKPDKAFFNALTAQNGLEKNKTVMFGDNYENDCLGAENAGLSAVWLSGENNPAVFYSEFLCECK